MLQTNLYTWISGSFYVADNWLIMRPFLYGTHKFVYSMYHLQAPLMYIGQSLFQDDGS